MVRHGECQGDQGDHVSYLGLTGGLLGGKDQGKSSHGRQAMTLPGATTLQVSQMCPKGDYSPASLQNNTGAWLTLHFAQLGAFLGHS